MKCTGSVEGVHLYGFGIECDNKADNGIVLDRQRFCSFEHLRIRNYNLVGFNVYVTGSSGPDDNFMFNTISNIGLESTGPSAIGLRLRGTSTGNPTHNKFANVMVTHANIAIQLDDCDNNAFLQTYCFQSVPTTSDVEMRGPSDTAYGARSNYFFHLEGVVHAANNTQNMIFGYDRENGQAAPIIDAGAQLLVIASGNNAQPWLLTERMRGLMGDVTADPNKDATTVDNTVFGFTRAGLGARLLWGVTMSPREIQSFATTDGTPSTQWLGVTNSGVSLMRVGGMKQTSSVDVPTSGSWTVGDIVWSTAPSFGAMAAGNYTVIGWRRLTTGTGNVLNTDWAPMRCLTGT